MTDTITKTIYFPNKQRKEKFSFEKFRFNDLSITFIYMKKAETADVVTKNNETPYMSKKLLSTTKLSLRTTTHVIYAALITTGPKREKPTDL